VLAILGWPRKYEPMQKRLLGMMTILVIATKTHNLRFGDSLKPAIG